MKLASPDSPVISYVNGSVPGYLCYLQLFAKMKKKKFNFLPCGKNKDICTSFLLPKRRKNNDSCVIMK